MATRGYFKSVAWLGGLSALALGIAACSVETASDEGVAEERQVGASQEGMCMDPPCGPERYCGDGVCYGSENGCNCPDDCSTSATNGKCETCVGESYGSDPHDCTTSNTNTGE